jgi:hypothetical protein
MSEFPGYAIIGRGRWAKVMREILTGEGRKVSLVEESRQRWGESDADHMARLGAQLQATGAKIAWLCLPPGPHIPFLMQAALDAGLHAVVEKPWLCTHGATEMLAERASSFGLIAGIHYEFCLLDSVAAWHGHFENSEHLEFGARFLTSKPARHDTQPIDDLGSHLFSIREYAAPRAKVTEIECGYGMPDERRAWLARAGKVLSAANFTLNREPIIQRFIAQFEQSATASGNFPFDLEFAMRVADATREWTSQPK